MQAKQVVVAILTPLVTGSATFGAIALNHYGQLALGGSGRVHAAAQSSPEPEALLAHWPQQCKVLRQALLSQADLTELTYEARPLEPLVTPAWKLNWQGETLALPLVDYSDVRVARNEDGRLFVVLEDRKLKARVMINQLKQPQPLVDVFATVPHPSLALAELQGEPIATVETGPIAGARTDGGAAVVSQGNIKAMAVKHSRPEGAAGTPKVAASELVQDELSQDELSWDGPSLTERLFEGPVALESLIDEGYRHRPQALGCKAEAWEKELPMAMGLALKLSTGNGTAAEAVYAKVGQQPGRVLRYRSADQTTWQARFGAGEFYSDVTIALPSDHESAPVGLGMGQENWWDAEPRPEWLVALERAVEVDSIYAWQALSVELHRAGMSEESAQSIQKLTAE
jgi:hypothetical protein